jgi:hypothetical protein
MNTAISPRITRSTFFDAYMADYHRTKACAYRRAWRIAVNHRAARALRDYFREIMREAAKEAVTEARKFAALQQRRCAAA